jgi:phosphoglycolate phosphatase
MTASPPPFQALIFDLDGTLIDSLPDVRASVNCVLTASGRRELTIPETKDFVGWGGRVLVEKALALTGEEGTIEEIDRTLKEFLVYYAAHRSDHTEVFPGVPDILEEFKSNGIKMGICTNKPTATTSTVLEALGLDGFFQVISCGDAVPHSKPDGRHVSLVAEQMGATCETAVMIGDSENDILAAIDAGVRSVAVSFGYTHLPVDELGADAVIDRFEDLPEALVKISEAS